MKLQIAIWSSPDEAPEHFVESTYNHTGLSFSTALPGGFSDCSFTVPVSGWKAVKWYRTYLGYHVVVFDHLGRRAYEGRIEDVEKSANGVAFTLLGYYSHAEEVTRGLIYPSGSVATATTIINDAIDLSDLWVHDHSMVQELTADLSPQDFSLDKKLSESITEACRYGDDSLTPRPMYFAIWEHRRPYFFAEPTVLDSADWRVYVKDFASSSGMTISRTRSTVWNKLQVIYDDQYIGQTFTDWAEDEDSQRLYGVREGTINIGDAEPGLAEVIRDLAIASYAKPTQNSQFGILGRVYTPSGAPDLPYMVRAGQMLQIMDYDPSVAQLVGGSSGDDTSNVFISRTQYDADSNELVLDLGRSNVALDLLMARLGTSGSVQ